jgi:hypothetical protein
MLPLPAQVLILMLPWVLDKEYARFEEEEYARF